MSRDDSHSDDSHSDDSQMSRFETQGLLRGSAREAIFAIAVVCAILLVIGGGAIRGAGEEQGEGASREIMLALAGPAEDVADALPLADAAGDLTSGLSPDGELSAGGFDQGETTTSAGTDAVPPVTADAFNPESLGLEPPPPGELDTLLVTGDSLSTPLDIELAKRFADTDVGVVREPHLATGISRSDLVDWGQLSASQVAEHDPDAIVLFIGANEGYSMPVAEGGDLDCCDAEYAAEFARRARQMLAAYRQEGDARVYWVTVPPTRDPDREVIANLVNESIAVAASPWAAQVELIDSVPIVAPDGTYSDSLEVNGEDRIIRESDGIHLNELGSSILADEVLARLDEDLGW